MAKSNRKLIDLIEQVFGRLTVIEEGPRKIRTNGKPRRRWYCQCECGSVVLVPQVNLMIGKSKSCGCYRVDFTRKVKTIHNLCRTPEYSVWQGIKDRCFAPRTTGTANYKGRGITVCERYRNNFIAFYVDVGPKPSSEHSIDRINNNGHYSCGNCEQCLQNQWKMNIRWATKQTQSNNTRRNRFLTVNGEKFTVAQWARKMSLKPHVIDNRLRDGWSDSRAVLTPVRQTRPRTIS